jgi:hypothetical protein
VKIIKLQSRCKTFTECRKRDKQTITGLSKTTTFSREDNKYIADKAAEMAHGGKARSTRASRCSQL